MLAYLVVFPLSWASVALGERRVGGRRQIWALGPIVGLILVCGLAAVRDYTVGGPDVMIYGLNVFKAAVLSDTLGQAIDLVEPIGIRHEPGYVLINFVVSRFTQDVSWLFFVVALVTHGCVLIGILILREYGSVGLMWLTYLCSIYTGSFNLQRQSIAIALCLLGFALVVTERRAWGLLIGLSSIAFHNSGVLFFVVFVIAITVKRLVISGRISVIRVAAILCGVLSLGALAFLRLGPTIFEDKFDAYVLNSERTGFALGYEVLYRIIPLVFFWAVLSLREKRRVERSQRCQLSGGLEELGRIGRGVQSKTSRDHGDLLASRSVSSLLWCCFGLLLLELFLLPIREVSYPFYRIILYFGAFKVLAYAIFARASLEWERAATVATYCFIIGYFVLAVFPGAWFSSALFTDWLRTW